MDVVPIDTVEEAIEHLRNETVDVLVVDMFIPGLSGNPIGGKEIIDLSLDLDPLRPIVVVTGYGTTQLMRKAFTAGVFDFIDKSEKTEDELVAAVQRALDLQADKVLRSGNPFTPMAGVEPRIFGGRTEELKFLEQKLNRVQTTGLCEHFLVLGDWGIGKSTLLREYKKICRSRGHVACIVPMEAVQKDTRLVEIARSLIEGILLDCPYPIGRFKRSLEFFQSFGISVLGSGLQFSRDVTQHSFSPKAFLHDALLAIKEDLDDKADVLVLLLDDLDNLQAVPEFVATIRAALSMRRLQESRVLVGISSTPQNWMKMTASDAHHPIARYFMSRVELGPLTEAEVLETIRGTLGPTGISFSSEVLNRVFAFTRGHPFEMQLLCSSLFDNQMADRVTVDVWDSSLQCAVKMMEQSTFDRWLKAVTEHELDVLRILARSDIRMTMHELRAALTSCGLSDHSALLEENLSSLSEKRMIVRFPESRYAISDSMFSAYLRSAIDRAWSDR